MKFALVNGERREAQRGLRGTCQGCDAAMIPKCGEKRADHWAHKSRRRCDPWWEETQWHRDWKNQFPEDWQEVVHYDAHGERHIADVKTEDGWFIEFQHSPIKNEERDSRDAFYQKLVWVVDGKRRQRDEKQFVEALKDGITRMVNGIHYCELRFSHGRMLEEWAGRATHVMFDFGHPQLWWLIAERGSPNQFVRPVEWAAFVQALGPLDQRGDHDFGTNAESLMGVIAEYRETQRAALKVQRRGFDPLAIRPKPRRRL